MIKCFKKAISSVLAAAMLATSFTAMPINTFAATSFSAAGGWFETLYAEWAGNKLSLIHIYVGKENINWVLVK